MAKMALIIIGLAGLALILEDSSNSQGSILSKIRGKFLKENSS